MSDLRPDEDEVVREANSRPNDDRHALRTWVAEARRARTSEVQKDTVIKALADALDKQRGHMGRHAFGCKQCFDVDAALRLAGRL